MKALLDTNILIDLLGRRQPYFDDCLMLLYAADFGDIELWVSPKSFVDAFYVLRKEVGSAPLQDAFELSLEKLNVTALDGGEVGRAAARKWTDFEDCFVNECALSASVDCIVTRDVAGFRRSELWVGAPKDLFEKLEQELGIVYAFETF